MLIMQTISLQYKFTSVYTLNSLMSPETRVIVRGVGLCAGLNKVTVALILAVLTFELVAPVHVNGVGIAISHKVNMDILADEIVHRPNLICYETVKWGNKVYRKQTNPASCLLNAVGTETLIK